MNKKVYQQPTLQTVNINIERALLAGSNIKQVSSNIDIEYKGGSDGPVRGRKSSQWSDEEEEEEF